MEIQIKTTPETEQMLAKFPGEFRKALVEGFGLSVKFAESQIKKSFGRRGKPKVKSGHLRRSITSSVKEGQNYITGILSSDLVYAAILEEGGKIRAKRHRYLNFKIGDGWVNVREVTIPPLPYLEPGIKDNLKQIEDIILKTIQKRVG